MKTNIEIIRTKTKEEWLEHRKSGLGSSEVATILGVNPYETVYQLWRRHMGIDPPKAETFAMKAGHYLEDAVSLFWQDETKREVIKSSGIDFLIVNKKKDFLRASPDRTFWIPGQPKNHHNKGILECKTTQKKIEENDIPKHWFCQVQYQLGVAELEQGSLAWLSAGRDFGYLDIAFNADFFEMMIEILERYWIDNFLGKKEPDQSNSIDVSLKFPRQTEGKIVEADEQLLQVYSSLRGVKDEIAALEKQKEDLEEILKMKISDAEAIEYAGQTLATWKAGKNVERFDTKRFKEENPELAMRYLTEQQPSRRFLLK